MNLNYFRMKVKQVLIALIFFLGLSFISKTAWATEGLIELNSTKGTNQRCFAMSMQTMSLNYSILLSCINLVYPSDSKIETYVIWANPIQPTTSTNPVKPIRLGELGFGKVQLSSPLPFSSLFVTLQPINNSRAPTEETVMQGNVQPISFLTEAQKTTLIPVSEISKTVANVTPTKTITSTKAPTAVSNLVRAFVTFVAILLAVVILGVVIFVIYRYRKSSV